jgi:Peptidase A4 family
MSFVSKCSRLLLYISLVILLFLAGCSESTAGAALSIQLQMPAHPLLYKFDLSSQQGLRDIAGDLSVREHGADTGIAVLPGEKVEIFASGSARVQSGGEQLGPEGLPSCPLASRPEPSLPCYSVIYSVGIAGQAGEVGTQVGFNPATSGNLFMGMNTSNLASNSGSFHITVLIIPSGTIAGLWATPQDNFTIQGTTMTLAAHVFAQNATIDTVQFTADVPGQAAMPICEAMSTNDDTYSCAWDFTLKRTYFHNGPVSIGFTVAGKSNNGKLLQAMVNPDGVRTGVARHVVAQPSDNYVGYAATDFSQSTTYTKVIGHWTVPQVACSPGETSLSAIWVGMTDGTTDNSSLAQLGTESGCQFGVPQYFMWWEMFPAPSVTLSQPLQPGDSVTSTVAFANSQFHLSMENAKAGVHFSTTQPGNALDTSIAECIAEAPAIIDNAATNSFHIARLTNFGKVRVSCQLNNNEPIANGPQNVLYQMQTRAGFSKATASDLDQAGTTFTIQWHHG